MTLITELHSTHLSSSCMKQVSLVKQGKYDPEMPTAMYKGSLAGKACEYLHDEGEWADSAVVAASIKWARDEVHNDLQREGRRLTDATERGEMKSSLEVGERIFNYWNRFGLLFSQCDHIGTELPVRWTLEHPSLDEPFSCASHIDLLCRDTVGVFGRGADRLILVDWKYTKESPTFDYLGRHQQLMLYQMMLYEGEVLLGGEWVRFTKDGIGEWCDTSLIHLPSLHVYKKASGGHKKGDEKPLDKVMLHTNFREDRSQCIKDELAVKAKCYELDLFPANPDPIGCKTCCSRAFCDDYSKAKIYLD